MTLMTRDRVAPLVLTCALAACMHNFDAFEPAPDATAPPSDANAPDAGGSDVGPTDGTTDDPAPSDAPSDSTAPCTETGAIALNGHCYFLTTASASWDTSRATCVAAGAHLVTIASASEQAAIEALAPTKDRWIGLSRPVGSPARDASYVWITGEPRTYTNWDSGEPNGSGECVRLRVGGRWAGNICASAVAAICERD
jgi:hypothetical protein